MKVTRLSIRQDVSTKGFKQLISIGTIWLFQISAIIGISLGHQEWFITKTPLNLIIAISLLILNYPIKTASKGLVVASFFVTGMLAEWVGVHYDFLFGAYYYGSNLGIKLDGVPLIIGINWAVLTLITGTIAHHFSKNLILRIVIGAFLMVFLDFFLEVSAPKFDFWHWGMGHAPIRNFTTWFILATALQWVLQKTKTIGNLAFSIHLYLAQLVFFIYFYVYHKL
ncbi:MAG: carotenoid biosynthesis protein [Bacteroidota bacterium]